MAYSRLFVWIANFYPRSPCGERLPLLCSTLYCGSISIHALLAESDRSSGPFKRDQLQFLSTLSLRRATKYHRILPRRSAFLSTLSLRRATWVLMGGSNCDGNFYPRSPCGERLGQMAIQAIHNYFYPRSPCGERLSAIFAGSDSCSISIHALLAESDSTKLTPQSQTKTFLSTLSLRRATFFIAQNQNIKKISIHALLAESDL